MKFIKKLLSLFYICCFAVHASGQDIEAFVPQGYSLIPPAPEVAALVSYVETPVSPFTGQPAINLPLYTLRDGSLELPVSLSYRGGGIKAYENPGIAGYGWTLNAGGCVALSVRGLPDFFQKGGQYGLRGLAHLQPKDKQLRDSVIYRNENRNYISIHFNSRFLLPYSLCADYDDGKVDMANDIYHFKCNNYSGTFILNFSNSPSFPQIIMSTDSPIKIQSSVLTIDGGEIIMIDDMHTQYLFDEGERTCFNYSYYSGGENIVDSIFYTSALYLKRITDIYGDTIAFSYTDFGKKRYCVGATHNLTKYTTGFDGPAPQLSYNINVGDVEYYCKRLTTISSKSTFLNFEYDPTGEQLLAITVYNKKSTPEQVKRYNFAFNDFIELDHIDEISTQNDTIRLYTFNYDNRFSGNRHGIDHWGYYNGANNQFNILETGADMEPSLNYTRYRILTDITYATGGTTHFDWEQNDYSYISSQNVANTTQYIKTKFSTAINGAGTGNEITASTMDFDNLYVRNFTINNSENQSSSIVLYFKDYITPLLSGPFANCLLADSGAEYMKLHGAEYGNIDNTYPRVELVFPNGTINTYYIDYNTCSRDSILVMGNIVNGNYQLRIRNPYNFTDVSPNVVNEFFGSCATNTETSIIGKVKLNIFRITSIRVAPKWGGLRVAKVTSSSNFYNSISKSYRYCDNISANRSSGTILEDPRNKYKSERYVCTYRALNPASFFVEDWSHYEFWTSSALFHTPTGGSHIEYPFVWECFDDSLKIKYSFDSQRDFSFESCMTSSFYDLMSPLLRIITSKSHMVGNLLSKTYYHNNEEYKRDTYTYNTLEATNQPWLTGSFHLLTDYAPCHRIITGTNDIWGNGYAACLYKLIPYNKRLISQSTSEVDPEQPSPRQQFTTGEQIEYFNTNYSPNPQASFIKSVSREDSDGNIYTTYYTYFCHDGSPIELKETEVTILDGKIVSAKKNVYDNSHRLIATFRAPTGIATLPEYQLNSANHTYFTPQQLLEAINIPEYSYKYDFDGHIVEIAYNNTPLASYLWGYKGSHPIVEVKNISYEQMCSQLPTQLTPNALLQRYDLSQSDLSIIRNIFTNHEVTTITYDWLVGIGEMTDSRGVTTRYGYDDFNRLSEVKDFNNFLIAKYNYNYYH